MAAPPAVEVLKEGWLKKKSPKAVLGRHVWQARYFVLESDRLMYFKKKPSGPVAKDDDPACLGVLPSEAINCVEELKAKNRCRFNIILHGTERTFQLLGDTAFATQRWVAALGKLAKVEGAPTPADAGEKFWKAKNYKRNQRRKALSIGVAKAKPQPVDAKMRQKTADTKAMILHTIATNKCVAFDALNEENRATIVDLMWRVEVKKDEDIIQIGEKGDNFYVIEQGSVVVLAPAETEEEKKLQPNSQGLIERDIQHGGSHFLDLALMYHASSKATYSALTDCTLWTIDRGLFQVTVTAFSEQKLNLYEQFLRSTDLIGKLGETDIAKVADALEEKVYASGQNVVVQGEQGDAFYLLKSGEAIVYVNGKEVSRYTKPGSYFGERALLNNQVRAATVTATGAGCTCLFLGRDAFTELLGPLSDRMAAKEGEYAEQKAAVGAAAGEPAVAPANGAVFAHHEHKAPEPVFVAARPQPDPNRPRIKDIKELRVIGTLGKGTFGHVQLVEDSNHNTYALKSISKAHIVKHNQQEHIVSEKKVMEQLNHPFIIRLFQTLRDNNFLYLLLEPCLGGELFSALREKVKFKESTARFFAAGVVLAFEHMHNQQIIYRDLKPENLILDAQGYLKITDFGFAKKIKNRTWTFCGTPDYLAPEIISSTGHGNGVDWWTLGILIFEMLAGYPPFYDETSVNKIYAKILVGKVAYPRDFSEEAKSIVGSLLQLKPTKRLGVLAGGATLIKEHPWFAGFDWSGFLRMEMPAPFVKQVKNQYDISNFDEYPDEDDYEEYDPRDAEDPTWDECFDESHGPTVLEASGDD